MKKRILAMLLAITLVIGMVPVQAFATETEPAETAAEVVETTAQVTEASEMETTIPEAPEEEITVPEATEPVASETAAAEAAAETENAQSGTSLDTSDLTFDVAAPAGYVTISFVDNGIRPADAAIDNEELYGTPVGTLIEETEVPIVAGDSVADVTVRLFNAMGLAYDCTGTVDEGFYLASVNDFELNGKYYPTFGEFDAGVKSGWCIRLNNWHIDQGTSDFTVEDGDTISWLYTCQYGADIGADFSTKSAAITAVKLTDAALSLSYHEENDVYTCKVPNDLSSIAFAVELENYASLVTVTVDGNAVKYRPNKAIPVTPASTVVITSTLEYIDTDTQETTYYTDTMTIQLTGNLAPSVNESAPGTLEVYEGAEFSVDVSPFFADADSDSLTYTVSCEALGLNQILSGSTFTGSIPTAGTYEVTVTASDGMDAVTHRVTVTVKPNNAPAIKAEYAETKGKTYVYSSSYVYIYMDDIFEDADGDTLSYEATLDGEKVDVTYNSWSKQYYIQFAEKPVIREYKIRAYDGKAYSEEFTARCIGTSATITPAKGYEMPANGSYYYYVLGTAEKDTFAMDYTLDVDCEIVPAWMSSNGVLTSHGDGTFTVGNLTGRTQVYVGAVYGKDSWGSDVYLGTRYIYLLPAMPAFTDITAALAEHADNQTATTVSNAVSGGWYSSEFEYQVANPNICDLTTSGSYGLKVTPKALGTTTVIATCKFDASIKAYFNVTVTGKALKIQGQNGSDDVIYEEGKTVRLEVLGAEEGEVFTYTSADEAVATVDETGLVTVKGLGQTYLTAASSTGAKASMYLQVKEAGKVYLDDLAVTDWSYFEGFISDKSGFNSAQLTYDWSLAETRYTYNKLAFTPYFDDEKLDATLHYQVSGGEYQTMALESGKAVSVANGLNPGENLVTIDVCPTGNPENVTTYTFSIWRPYNPTNTITRMTIYPSGETALNYPTYLNNKEGTIYQWDTAKNDFVYGWGNRVSTGWSSSRDTFKTFVFGDRTGTISVYPTFGYVNQRVMIYVDGVAFEEAVNNWKSKPIPVDADGTVITFHVNSEKYHAEQLAAGVEDPYAVPEKVYTLIVESVSPLGIGSKILSAEIEGGEFYAPGFASTSYTISALIPAGQTTANLSFTVPAGIDVYKTSVSDANKLEPTGQDESGNNRFTTPIVTITGTGMYAYSTTNIILQVTDGEGNVGQTQYGFTVSQRGAKDVYPDRIVEYLCIGSQYTNAGSYGLTPERTLKNQGGVLSLGNFGGYIVYQYDIPIENDPSNPYGVDFVIYGNSFGATGAAEPGYVQVSGDGETWYTLAGSAHFEDYCDWGYTMTYTNNGGKSAWSNSDGESGEIYNYPTASLYPYYNWTEAGKQSITAAGPRLNSAAKDAYGSAAAVVPEFGYVDVNPNGSITGAAVNPYDHPVGSNNNGGLKEGGDMFDLSWAVDASGNPVQLSSISYIRVATASSIYAGAIGEKSTEVTAVMRVTNAAEASVGVTAAPSSITVNDRQISVPANGEAMVLPVSESALDVAVTASEGANIYIGGNSGSQRSYDAIPDKGIIRIIVQEGEKAPYICYLTVESGSEEDVAAANAVAEKISAIGSSVELGDMGAIEAAREAYDALPEYQKRLVSNYDVLVAAEAELQRLKDENTAVPIHVSVTISDAGRVVLAQQSVTVTDKNDNGLFDVDDVLTVAHNEFCPGGYASAETQWGLGITRLWGDESGSFGYWLNDASCWSLEDTVAEGDSLIAFVYQDKTYWSDAYAKFDADSYVVEEDLPLTVSVEKAGYDENWNTVFAAYEAVLTVLDSELNEIDPSAYMQSGNKITIYEPGEYYLTASGVGSDILVPAIAKLTVTNGPDAKLVGGKSVTLTAEHSGKVIWTLAEEYAPYASITKAGRLTAKKVVEMVTVSAVAVDAADGETVVETSRIDIYPAVSQVKILDESGGLVNGKTIPVKINDGSDETYVFSAGTYPDDAMGDVTWTVSDKKGAYVTCEVRGNDIILKPAENVKKGTVTLTATATDGSNKKATLKLNIAVLVEDISVTTKNSTNMTLDDAGNPIFTAASGKSVTLTAAPVNSNATNKAVAWSVVEGSEYADITSAGKLTVVKDLMGVKYAVVRAEAKDGSGVYRDVKVKLTPLALGVQLYNSGKVCANTTLVQNMTAQNTLTLNARVYPLDKANPSVTWKSSNAKVASVAADGTVTCLKAGKVTITATADDGSKEKAAFTLNIVEGIESLSLEDQAVAVKKNLNLAKLIAINPATATNKKLKWEIIGDASGATISSAGVLNTKKVDVSGGPVVLTVSASPQDGCGAAPAVCTVTVYPATTKVAILKGEETVTGKTVELEAGKSLTLKGICEGAANVYTWKSNNKNVAVEDGVVTATEAAVGKTVTITCTAMDGTNKKAAVKIRIVAPEAAE